jgi:hypothetical protein
MWGPEDEEAAVMLFTRIPCEGELVYRPGNSKDDGVFAEVTEVRWYGGRVHGVHGSSRPRSMRAWLYLDGAEVYDRAGMPDCGGF